MWFASDNMFYLTQHEKFYRKYWFRRILWKVPIWSFYIPNMYFSWPVWPFRESNVLICCQDKYHTTILNFVTFTQTHVDFNPIFKVLIVILQLSTGRNLIRLEKLILGCKFHILGIKTTLGQHIAKKSSCLIGSIPYLTRFPCCRTEKISRWYTNFVNQTQSFNFYRVKSRRCIIV